MRSQTLARLQVAVVVARAGGALAAVVWGWYIVATFRSQHWGFALPVLGVAAVFVFPAAIVPWLGLRWRAVLLGTAVILVAAVASAEWVAVLEEFGFSLACRAQPPGAGVIVRARSWPFAHHHLYYDPSTGQRGGGD